MTAQVQKIYKHWDAFEILVNAVRPEADRLTKEKNDAKAKEIVEAVQRVYSAISIKIWYYEGYLIVDAYHQKAKYPIELDHISKRILSGQGISPTALLELSLNQVDGKSTQQMMSVAQALNIAYYNPLNVLGSTWGPLYGESEALKNVRKTLLEATQTNQEEKKV